MNEEIIIAKISELQWVLDFFCTRELKEEQRIHIRNRIRELQNKLQ